MLTVYKYPVTPETRRIDMPAGATVLSADVIREDLFIWALVDNTRPLKAVPVSVVGTGHDASVAAFMKFLGTCLFSGGALVFHVFVGKQAE